MEKALVEATEGSAPARVPTPAREMWRRVNVLRLRTYGLVGAIVLLGAYFEYGNSAFLSSGNLVFLLRSASSLALIAFAEMFVIIQGELDLSVGSVYLLSSSALAVLWLGGGALPFTMPFWAAVIVSLLIGVVAGLVNGFLTTVVRIPSFIVTLGMLNVAQGLALLLTSAASFNPAYNNPKPSATDLRIFHDIGGSTLPFGIPVQVLWLVIFFVIFWLVRHRTLYGFRSVAIGGNPEAAKVVRLPIKKYKVIAFVVCAVMASVAGLLDFSYTGSVGPSAGGSLTFPVFAAVVIGGTALTGGRGTIFGTLLGALLLSVLNNGLAILGVGAFVQLVVVGTVTIAAVAIDQLSSRLGRRRATPKPQAATADPAAS